MLRSGATYENRLKGRGGSYCFHILIPCTNRSHLIYHIRKLVFLLRLRVSHSPSKTSKTLVSSFNLVAHPSPSNWFAPSRVATMSVTTSASPSAIVIAKVLSFQLLSISRFVEEFCCAVSVTEFPQTKARGLEINTPRRPVRTLCFWQSLIGELT